MKPKLPTIVALLLGVGVGIVLSGWMGRHPPGPPSDAQGTPPTKSAARVGYKGTGGVEFPVTGINPWESAQQKELRSLAGSDPERALAMAGSIQNPMERSQAILTVISTISASDPQRAANLLDTIPPGPGTQEAMAQIAAAWGGRDPDAATAWVMNLEPFKRSKAVEGVVLHLMLRDAPKTADFLSKVPPSGVTGHLYSQLGAAWASQDPDRAIAWCEGLTGDFRRKATDGVLRGLVNGEPVRAATLIERVGVSQQNQHTVSQIVGSWLRADPTAAVAWMDQLQVTPDIRRNILSNTIRIWAERDVAEAAAYVKGLRDGPDALTASYSLAVGWGATDPAGAKVWITDNLQGESRNAALSTLIQNAAYRNPSMAVAFYEEARSSLSPEEAGKAFPHVSGRIAGAWAMHDGAAAADWVLQLPTGPDKVHAIGQLVDQWGEYDLEGTARFVLALQEGPERQEAVEQLVRDALEVEPDSAFAWANSSGDEGRRESLVRMAAQRWAEQSRDEAIHAVQGADLGEAAKKRILESLEPG